MKKYFLKLIPAVFIFLYSCEYETLPTYSGIDQIYFNFADVAPEATSFSNAGIVKFGYDDVIKSDSTIRITVKVMGSVADYDRPVNFRLVELPDHYFDEGTYVVQLGRDFDLLPDQSMVRAGSITGSIVVRLRNTEALDNKTFVAPLRLLENEHFKADYTHTRSVWINERYPDIGSMYYIFFDNESDMPNLWAHPSNIDDFTRAFGPYSRKKFELMCQVLTGCTRELFTYAEGENAREVFSDRFSIMVISAWGRAFNVFLREYELTHGEPMLEENGELMVGGIFL